MSVNTSEEAWMAEDGMCSEDCQLKFISFLLVFLVLMICTFMIETAAHSATIRYTIMLPNPLLLVLQLHHSGIVDKALKQKNNG